MHLLSALCSGFPAAANGTAEIRVRGSSTRATWYASLEGDSANSSGSDIVLDAHGSALVYVNQFVDVVVKDDDGTVVRSFGDGVSAPNVEVRSPAFTGIDYDTAERAPGNPTNLKSVLDLWLTNSGAVDWKVLVAGSATTLTNAFGITTGMWFNVKSPAYGAVGDGVNNDQTAIAAALAAAVAAGGGIVFFPKGTYLITTAIEWDHRVSIVGVGADLSIITTDSAANARIFTWTAGTAQEVPITIAGLSFESTQSNTGSPLYATVAMNVVLDNLNLCSSATSTGTPVSFTAATQTVIVRNCRFNLNGSATTAVALSSTTRFFIDTCKFVATTTTWAGTLLTVTGRGSITRSIFDITAVTAAGVANGIANASGNDVTFITHNLFHSSAQTYDAVLNLTASSFVVFHSNDLEVTSAVTWYTVGGVLRDGSFLQAVPRQRAASATTATVRDGVELFEMDSATTVPTITLGSVLYPGQKLLTLLKNDSGSTWLANVTFTGAQIYGTVASNAQNGELVVGEFVASDLEASGTYVWINTSVKINSAN